MRKAGFRKSYFRGLGRNHIAFRIQFFSWANSLCPGQGKHMMRKTEGQLGNSVLI
jgi:hypothetical protein